MINKNNNQGVFLELRVATNNCIESVFSVLDRNYSYSRESTNLQLVPNI